MENQPEALEPIRKWTRLKPDLIGALGPDTRDALLDMLEEWATPEDLLAVLEILREVHGPLLFLLDRQARATLASGDAARALEIIERRIRRSATAAAQVLEARALFALGRTKQAHDAALELLAAPIRASGPLRDVATLLVEMGDFAHAAAPLNDWLTQHPGHLAVILTAAQVALAAGETEHAEALADRLGPGVPTELDTADLKQLAGLLGQLGRSESQRAVTLEVERRRLLQEEKIAGLLAPYISIEATTQPGENLYPSAVFQLLNGPESVPITPSERRALQIAAIRNFGFGELRSGQAETMACVLRGESVLTIMPTGAGKSLCYQLPALTMPRASLIISPLIALMKDQVEGLPAAARPRATFINSTIDEAEYDARMKGIAEGRYKLIYAAPERLRQRPFLRALRTAGLDLFVIDEAHCVSLWGHDFRPDYLFLAEARRELGSPTTLAMTATAPPRVRDEILDAMAPDGDSGLQGPADADSASTHPRVITMDVFRNNLHLSAIRFNNEEEKRHALLAFVTSSEGSGIVYVNTRMRAARLAQDLRAAGVSAEAYHAGMSDRSAIQERFMGGQTRVVVATVAFGMGIDKADIRFIVHFHPARSLASYYQEVGRAGRDGKLSQGVLFYSGNDWANMRRWARTEEYSIPYLLRVYTAIASQIGGESSEHSEMLSGAVDTRRLQQVLNLDETAVRVAISILERADLLTRSFDVAQEVGVTMPKALPASAREDEDFRTLVRTLRLGPGQSGTFRMASLANSLDVSLSVCESLLLDWEAKRYVALKLARRAMSLTLPPLPEGYEARLERLLAQSQALALRRIDDIGGYATFDGCRHGYISAQFGSPPRTSCTVCDNCTGIRPDLPAPVTGEFLLPDDEDIQPLILDCLLSLPRPLGRTGLTKVLGGRLDALYRAHEVRHYGALKGIGDAEIVEYIDEAVESGLLRLTPRASYTVLSPSAEARTIAEAWLDEHPEMAIMAEPPVAEEGADTASPEAGGPPAAGPEWTDLQRALWGWRKRLADEAGQPPYVILTNDVMLRIAMKRPATAEALGQLEGIGVHRLERYGPAILDLIRLHPREPDDERILAQQMEVSADANAERRSAHSRKAKAESAGSVTPAVERKIMLKLEEIRQRVAVEKRMRQTEVASRALLNQIAMTAPATLDALEGVFGFRSSELRDNAQEIVACIAALRQA